VAISVKISERAKREVERVRQNLSRVRGRPLTVQEMLDAVVAVGSRYPDKVLEELSGIRYPLPPSRLKVSLALVTDIGPTSEEDIGVTLYGGRRRRRS
jgi:hypothetical protein